MIFINIIVKNSNGEVISDEELKNMEIKNDLYYKAMQSIDLAIKEKYGFDIGYKT